MLKENMGAKSSSLRRTKYRDSEYEDVQVDGLMRYFRFENYAELKGFLRGVKKGQ